MKFLDDRLQCCVLHHEIDSFGKHFSDQRRKTDQKRCWTKRFPIELNGLQRLKIKQYLIQREQGRWKRFCRWMFCGLEGFERFDNATQHGLKHPIEYRIVIFSIETIPTSRFNKRRRKYCKILIYYLWRLYCIYSLSWSTILYKLDFCHFCHFCF